MKSLKLVSSKQSNGDFKIYQTGQPEINFEDGKPVQFLRFVCFRNTKDSFEGNINIRDKTYLQ